MSRTQRWGYLGYDNTLPAPREITPETQHTPHPIGAPGVPLADGRHLLTTTEAARWLGIPPDRLKEFVTIDLLHPVGSRPPYFDLAELQTLHAGLLTIVKPCQRHGCDGVISRQTASAANYARQRFCSDTCRRANGSTWRPTR